jgi:hypothetical protein
MWYSHEVNKINAEWRGHVSEFIVSETTKQIDRSWCINRKLSSEFNCDSYPCNKIPIHH